MAGVELGDHAPQDFVELAPVADLVQAGEVDRTDGGPIHAVHIGRVEEIAGDAPRFLDDLPPFGRGSTARLMPSRSSLGASAGIEAAAASMTAYCRPVRTRSFLRSAETWNSATPLAIVATSRLRGVLRLKARSSFPAPGRPVRRDPAYPARGRAAGPRRLRCAYSGRPRAGIRDSVGQAVEVDLHGGQVGLRGLDSGFAAVFLSGSPSSSFPGRNGERPSAESTTKGFSPSGRR